MNTKEGNKGFICELPVIVTQELPLWMAPKKQMMYLCRIQKPTSASLCEEWKLDCGVIFGYMFAYYTGELFFLPAGGWWKFWTNHRKIADHIQWLVCVEFDNNKVSGRAHFMGVLWEIPDRKWNCTGEKRGREGVRWGWDKRIRIRKRRDSESTACKSANWRSGWLATTRGLLNQWPREHTPSISE